MSTRSSTNEGKPNSVEFPGVSKEVVAELSRLIVRFPRELGRLAVMLDQTDALLLGVLDEGVGLDALLGAAEMHGELGDLPDVATETGRKIVIVDEPSGWVPRVA